MAVAKKKTNVTKKKKKTEVSGNFHVHEFKRNKLYMAGLDYGFLHIFFSLFSSCNFYPFELQLLFALPDALHITK